MSKEQQPPTIRMRVIFSGHVQGVGFRYTTASIAQSHEVTGFVRNMPNGDVMLIVEGAPDEVRDFVSEVDRRMGRFIFDQKRILEPAMGGLSEFAIRY